MAAARVSAVVRGLSATENDRNDALLRQFGDNGLHRSSHRLRDSRPEVAEVNGGLPMRVRRQTVQHLPNRRDLPALRCRRFSPIHHAEKGHAGAFQFRTVSNW